MATETENTKGFNQSNDGYTTAGVIQLRLDTAPMLDQLEAFFRDTRVIGYTEQNGAVVPVFGKQGMPKMNDEGVQSILSWLTPLFSPHTVQGNFDDERYEKFIMEFDIHLSEVVMTNLHKWEIKIEDYNSICDMTTLTAQAFFSRCIDNKERESYAQTLKSVESNTMKASGGNFLTGMFSRGGG